MVTGASTPFVGRIRELAQLERVLDSTQAGAGATVLLAGEAGIGKTRLASETALRASERGFEVLLGRSIDLVGSELPYQPFLEALRPLGKLPQVDPGTAGSRLRMFEDTLALLNDHADAAPLLLVLEDVHWADASSLDLFLFLTYNASARRILLLATYRPDELCSAERIGRFAGAVRRSGRSVMLELGPLERDEVKALVAGHSPAPVPSALAEAIVARCEGNPFFAEELLSAAGAEDEAAELPRGLRALLLDRVSQLDAPTQSLLRVAAAAGRDVGYGLLGALAARPEPDVRASLRKAMEHGILVTVEATGRFRFRHALLAEAIYSTILPGEREELHAKLAEELARSGAASPAELAPHWAAAGRREEALTASLDAARKAEAMFGLAEAQAHLERALALWPSVPDAAERTELDLATVYAWAASIARLVGDAAHALELTRRAIELVGDRDPHRAVFLHVALAEDINATGSRHETLAVLERAAELVPAEPPSPAYAYALASLAGGLMLALRHSESLDLAEQALAVARCVGAREAEVRALTVVGTDLAHLGRGEAGIPRLRQAVQLANEIGDRLGLERAYTNFTDALMEMGRPRASARLAEEGIEHLRRHGIYSTVLVANRIESLLAIGDWDDADGLSAASLRSQTTDHLDWLLALRAALEAGRGELDAARGHIQAAAATGREDHAFGLYDSYLAELPLWERRWVDADAAVEQGLAHACQREAAPTRVQLSAKGLRVQAELAALARARGEAEGLRNILARAGELLSGARGAAADALPATPEAHGWLLLAEAEYLRARAEPDPHAWASAATDWERLERPPLAAYCLWRQAEAMVGKGASRLDASKVLRESHAVAAGLGAKPLLREIDLLAERARLDLAAPTQATSGPDAGIAGELGLTAREVDVLTLLARGYTNREIAQTLVISVKTASVHVSHILQKLGAANRREAAAVLHRLAPLELDRP